MEPVTRQVPLLGELTEASDGLEPLPMTNFENRERRNSISSVSTTASTVSIRHGRVRDIRPRKTIPDLHKIIGIMLVILCCLGLVWANYAVRNGRFGMFRQPEPGSEEEDIFEHERKVEWDGQDIAGFVVASVLIMIAAGGGIGGGGVLVPTYIFVLGFPPKYAIPLSNCTILGSSISNLILNVNKRHEYADRPLIDWDIMLMMEPLTVAGALVGTFVNVISPPWLITIMLVILLTSAAYRTLNKGVKRYKQETIRFERQASIKMDVHNRQDGYQALPETRGGDVVKDSSHGDPAAVNKFKADPSLPSASTVLAWSPDEVKQWWERSLPPGCQEYIHIVDECELDGADLLDLDYISLSQFDVKKMLIMKILRRIKQLKQSLGIPDEASPDKKTIKVAGGEETKMSNEDLDPIPPGERDPRRIKAEQEGNAIYVDILEDESIHPPWKVLLMFLCTGGMLTLTILKGGGDINPLNVECGQATYWVLTLSSLPWVLMISWIARNHLVNRYKEKEQCGYEYLPQDVVWDERATIRYPAICSTAGLCAGMFGIGGGIVKGPLMLEMGVYPPVTSATSATMILFTSAGASVSYLIFQQLNLNYGMYLFIFGLVFTLFGQVALSKLVKRSGRNSYIILIIGLTVALSAIAMGVASAGHLVKLFQGDAESGGDICGVGGE